MDTHNLKTALFATTSLMILFLLLAISFAMIVGETSKQALEDSTVLNAKIAHLIELSTEDSKKIIALEAENTLFREIFDKGDNYLKPEELKTIGRKLHEADQSITALHKSHE